MIADRRGLFGVQGGEQRQRLGVRVAARHTTVGEVAAGRLPTRLLDRLRIKPQVPRSRYPGSRRRKIRGVVSRSRRSPGSAHLDQQQTVQLGACATATGRSRACGLYPRTHHLLSTQRAGGTLLATAHRCVV